jgi:hypothetical protein
VYPCLTPCLAAQTEQHRQSALSTRPWPPAPRPVPPRPPAVLASRAPRWPEPRQPRVRRGGRAKGGGVRTVAFARGAGWRADARRGGRQRAASGALFSRRDRNPGRHATHGAQPDSQCHVQEAVCRAVSLGGIEIELEARPSNFEGSLPLLGFNTAPLSVCEAAPAGRLTWGAARGEPARAPNMVLAPSHPFRRALSPHGLGPAVRPRPTRARKARPGPAGGTGPGPRPDAWRPPVLPPPLPLRLQLRPRPWECQCYAAPLPALVPRVCRRLSPPTQRAIS